MVGVKEPIRPTLTPLAVPLSLGHHDCVSQATTYETAHPPSGQQGH
jgi:hypothetical protein